MAGALYNSQVAVRILGRIPGAIRQSSGAHLFQNILLRLMKRSRFFQKVDQSKSGALSLDQEIRQSAFRRHVAFHKSLAVEEASIV